MPVDQTTSVYYRELRLANVKAFIPGTRLDLSLDGRPAPWTLILGENGLGKTTLLQCLALMRPTLNVELSDKTSARQPEWVEPALPVYDDQLIVDLARSGKKLNVALQAEFFVGQVLRSQEKLDRRTVRTVETSVTYTTTERSATKKGPDFTDFDFSQVRRKDFVEPLVVAYSAARHPPYAGEVIEDEDPVASFFHPEIELTDAVKVLNDLDHASVRSPRAATLYEDVKRALELILPDVGMIEVLGPPVPGQSDERSGVWVQTYSGTVPLRSLSVGYQTMFAWIVDLAWRLAEHHASCKHPLQEPAIVLIDELDLHLHPKWQRRVRKDLSAVFPQVQFIVTTHSPVLAQTYLDTNIAVVERDGDHATINNEPRVVRSWRLDQVSHSLLHDFEPYSPEIVEAFEVRARLNGKAKLTVAERKELASADALVAEIPVEDNPADQAAVDLIREAAQLLAKRQR